MTKMTNNRQILEPMKGFMESQDPNIRVMIVKPDDQGRLQAHISDSSSNTEFVVTPDDQNRLHVVRVFSSLSNTVTNVKTEVKTDAKTEVKTDPKTDTKTDLKPEVKPITEPIIDSFSTLTKIREEVAWAFETRGLHTIAGLGAYKPLEHGVPTIRADQNLRYLPFYNRCADVKQFSQRLAKEAPYLADFDFAKYHLVLAGGAAAHILSNGLDLFQGDYDLFLVGPHANNKSAVQATIKALGDHLISKFDRIEVSRTVGCVTFHWSDGFGQQYEVQIVLSHFKDMDELLYGFDLGSSAVAYDGEQVWLSWPGKLAFERGVNVLDLSKRRGSYEARICRYFERGFSLVVPDLDLRRVGFNDGLELPYLKASGTETPKCRCCIYPGVLTSWGDRHTGGLEGSSYNLGKVAYHNPIKVLTMNLLALTKEDPTVGLCASTPYEPDLNVTKIQPKLHMEIMLAAVKAAFAGGKVHFERLVMLLGKEKALQAIEHSWQMKKDGKPPNFETFCGTRIQQLLGTEYERLRMTIPFTIDKQEIMTKYFPLRNTSKREWYGKMLNEEMVYICAHINEQKVFIRRCFTNNKLALAYAELSEPALKVYNCVLQTTPVTPPCEAK